MADVAIAAEIQTAIRTNRCCGDWAIQSVYEQFIQMLSQVSDPLIQERADDLKDVRRRLLRIWRGETTRDLSSLDRPVVVAAKDLLPSDTASMSQMAADLGLSVSTVSRALQGKSISFRGKIYPLRKLFTNNVIAAPEGKISSENVKRQILRFIGAEDALHPLSDEKLRAALETICLPVSRRVITKYREELGFPASCLRKKGADHNPTS